MSEQRKRSQYKIGDTVWFVASVSHRYDLVREVEGYMPGSIKYLPGTYTPMALIPIPIRGVIKSIYKNHSKYSPFSKSYITVGGTRITEMGEYAIYTEEEDIEYELECNFCQSVRATYSCVTNPPKFLTLEGTACFYTGKISVPDAFVASDPEEAEIRYNEKNCVTSILLDKNNRLSNNKLVNACLNRGKLILGMSKDIHNKKFGGYSEYLDTLTNDEHSTELLYYKYSCLFSIGR